MKIVVVGPGCWGSGESLKQALARALYHAPRDYRFSGRKKRGMPYNAYEASDDFDVDGMGSISASELKRIREVRYEVAGDGYKKVVREGVNILGD